MKKFIFLFTFFIKVSFAVTLNSSGITGFTQNGPYPVEWNGGFYQFTTSTNCFDYRGFSYNYGNSAYCLSANGGKINQGSSLVPFLESGAAYNRTSACNIQLQLRNFIGYATTYNMTTYGSMSGMSANGGTGMVTSILWSATKPNCQEALLSMGVTWAYSTQGSSFKSTPVPGYAWATYCVWADGVHVGCTDSFGSTGSTPPSPVFCDFVVPGAIEHGILSSSEVDGSIAEVSLESSCSRSNTVIMSFLNGTGTGTGQQLSLGDGIISNLCFVNSSGNCSSGSSNTLSVTVPIGGVTTKLRSALQASSPTAGEYTGNIIILLQPQ